MPYKSPEEVAEKVNGTDKLSAKKRRQFMHVFNSCWDKTPDEAKCHAMAWGAVKKSSSVDDLLKDIEDSLGIFNEFAAATLNGRCIVEEMRSVERALQAVDQNLAMEMREAVRDVDVQRRGDGL